MVEFGDFRYDAESRLLYRGDEEIVLPPRVLAVLESLLGRPGTVVPKQDLLEAAWDGDFVGEGSLTQAVSELRQTLGDDHERPSYIQTIPRRGYRLIAEVSGSLREAPAGDAHGAQPPETRARESVNMGAAGEPTSVRSVGSAASEAPPASRQMFPWALVGIMALVAVLMLQIDPNGSSTSPASGPIRVPALPADAEFYFPSSNRPPLFAISPDGTQLVYLGPDDEGTGRQLYRKPMDQLRGAAIRGTEGAGPGMFFSPDGEWIGFCDGNHRLWRIPVEGGSPVPISEHPNGHRGASWGADDTIVLTDGPLSGLVRVPAAGGALEPLTELDSERGEKSHRWPQWLPGGEAVLFNVWLGGSWDEAEVAIVTVEAGERRTLPVRGMRPSYVPTGHLLYGRAGALFAVPFDLERLEVSGSPVAVVDDVLTDSPRMGTAHYAVSAAGTLVYGAPDQEQPFESELVLFDRTGQTEALELPTAAYVVPRFSPDGRYLATTALVDGNIDIYVYDLERNSLHRITTHEGPDEIAVWTPDGERLIFGSFTEAGGKQLFSVPLDGSGPARRLLPSSGFSFAWPSSVSADGRVLLYSEQTSGGDFDLMRLSLEGDPQPTPLVRTRADEQDADFSPDGRFFAYASNESGRWEVYVRPYPDPSAWKRQISTTGGSNPVWGPDGRELFYREGDRIMVVPIVPHPEFSAAVPRPLFEERVPGSFEEKLFDVAPDGEQFVSPRITRQPTASMRMVLNWFEELERLVPTGR